MARTLTPKEIGVEWGASAKTVRKFLRADIRSQGGTIGVETPGKGGRWAIQARSLNSLKKRFDAWVTENERKAQERAEALKARVGADPLEGNVEVEAPEEDADAEAPTDAE